MELKEGLFDYSLIFAYEDAVAIITTHLEHKLRNTIK